MTRGLSLPNVGPGPDPFSLSDLETEFAVLLLHRDFYCSECRQQVRRVKSRYEEFEQRDAEVVSVLPEDHETAGEWQKQYHLPYPVLADAEKQLAEQYDQPTRYGLFGRIHDIIGRMPAAIVLDLRWSDPMETYAHRGDTTSDRPRIDDLLSALDSAAHLGADSTVAEREAAARATPDGTSVEPADSPAAGANEAVSGDASAPVETEGGSGTDDPADPAHSGDGAATADPAGAGPAETRGESDESDASATGDSETTEQDEAAESEPTEQDGAAEPGDSEQQAVPPLSVPDRVDLPENVALRRATEADAMPVIRVLHGALLEIDGATVRRAVRREDVIVAEAADWIVGALVLEDNHIDTLAVRREFRNQGIGSALIETAVSDIGGPVTADFRAGVRGFWQNLGFEIEAEDDRFYGIRQGE